MMNQARSIAIDRMKEDAKKMGANAVISMRIVSSNVMQGTCEIIAYGTAVVIE
jgi:uncharacterized protein YbjQ (UPF0145 family)